MLLGDTFLILFVDPFIRLLFIFNGLLINANLLLQVVQLFLLNMLRFYKLFESYVLLNIVIKFLAFFFELSLLCLSLLFKTFKILFSLIAGIVGVISKFNSVFHILIFLLQFVLKLLVYTIYLQ